MSRVSYIFDGNYTTDRGTAIPGLRGVTRDPADLGDFETILAAVGARLVTAEDRNPCPVSAGFRPRKVTFLRRSGNSFSLIYPVRANLIAVSNTIIQAVGADDPVVCIKSTGEKWDDLFPDLSTRGAAAVPGTDPETVGVKGWHKQVSNYTIEPAGGALPGGGANTIVQLKFKVQSDVINQDVPGGLGATLPPTILADQWTTCVGAPLPPTPCPGYQNVQHRRYKGIYQVTRGDLTAYASLEIPESLGTDASILACGTALANNASIVCLGYIGESIKNVHRLAGVTLLGAIAA